MVRQPNSASSSTHPYPRYLVQVICQLHALAALLPWNDPLYPFHRRLGEPRAGLNVLENRKITCFWRHSNPVPTALTLVISEVRTACKTLRYSGDEAP